MEPGRVYIAEVETDLRLHHPEQLEVLPDNVTIEVNFDRDVSHAKEMFMFAKFAKIAARKNLLVVVDRHGVSIKNSLPAGVTIVGCETTICDPETIVADYRAELEAKLVECEKFIIRRPPTKRPC